MTMNSEADLGVSELDKLIHSYEFENQQYVKMIDKENQLIDALQTQICNKSEQVSRLEVEISRFDEDAKRLHRQYTNNCDNIRSLRNTVDVMSAHETTLSKQLEAVRAKTDQDCKYYQSQVSNYTNIKDDYMKKYKSFPLAIELDHRKAEVAEAQENVDRLAAARKELEEKISLKEDELDGKIMSRIIIKMAETKLATHQLEKEIHQCLTEKTSLLEKLRELQISKQPEQVDELFTSHDEEDIEEQRMDTDNEENIMHVQVTEDEPKNAREPTEDFASLSISDKEEGVSVDSNAVRGNNGPTSLTIPCQDYSSSENAEHHTDNLICENIKNGSSVSPSMQALGVSEVQHMRAYDLSQDMGKDSGFEDAPMNQVQMTTISQQSPMDTRTSESPGQVTMSNAQLHQVSTMVFSSVSTRLSVPKLRKVSPITSTSKESVVDNSVQRPPSLRIPKLTVPQPPRIKPPPASARPLRLPTPQARTPSIGVQIKQPLPPTLLASNRKPNLLQIPKPPQLFHQQVKSPNVQSSETPEKREMQQKLQSVPSGDHEGIKVSASADRHESFTSAGRNARSEKDSHVVTGEKSVPQMKIRPNLQVCKLPVPSGQAAHSKEQNPLGSRAEVGISQTTECTSDPSTFKLNRPVNDTHDTPDQRTVTSGSTSMTNQAEIKADSANSSFSLGFLFDNFDKEPTTADEHEEDTTVPSIFNLFNMSQNPSSGHSEGNPTNETSSFFNFGKFTDDATSPGSDEGPSNLLNLFMKSSDSQHSNGGFAVNLGTDGSQSRGGEEDGGPAFTMGSAGKSKGFLAFSKNNSSDEDGDQPLFKLF